MNVPGITDTRQFFLENVTDGTGPLLAAAFYTCLFSGSLLSAYLNSLML